MRTLHVLALLLGLRLTCADELPQPSQGDLEKMFVAYPNTMAAYSFDKNHEEQFKKKTESFQKALKNGIRCELNTDDKLDKAETAFIEMYYKNGKDAKYIADEEKRRPEVAAQYKRQCTDPSTEDVLEKCLCVDKKFSRFCPAMAMMAEEEKAAAGTPAVCTTADALQPIAPKLYEMFTTQGSAKQAADKAKTLEVDFEQAIAELVAMGDVMCEVLEPKVQAAVKTIFESDVKYMAAEREFFAVFFPDHELFGENAFDTETDCATDEIEGALKQCICSGGMGLQVCYYKWLAETLKQLGYLDCTPDAVDATKPKKVKLDDTKKPTKAIAKAPRKPKAVKKTTAPAAATTKAPAKSAPAAAAAAALLLVPAAMLV